MYTVINHFGSNFLNSAIPITAIWMVFLICRLVFLNIPMPFLTDLYDHTSLILYKKEIRNVD